jgi:hypothetical protein
VEPSKIGIFGDVWNYASGIDFSLFLLVPVVRSGGEESVKERDPSGPKSHRGLEQIPMAASGKGRSVRSADIGVCGSKHGK